ncbi:MAG: glycosyltransferase family 4 protein [Hyphomicrobiaceae bacterium]
MSGLSERVSIGLSAVRQHLWRAATPLYFKAIGHVLPLLLAPSAQKQGAADRTVRVVGLLSTATGIGQSARLCAAAMQQAGHHGSTHDLSRLFGLDDGVRYAEGGAPPQAADISIFHINPPMLLIGLLAAGRRQFRRNLNIAYCAWELPEIPPTWTASLALVDAVFVPSAFCRDAVATRCNKPIFVVPHPVADAQPRGDPEPDTGDPFRVLSVFNCGSSLYRKNPAALIAAFKQAFGSARDVELVLKIADGHAHRADVERLNRLIGGAPNIRLVDKLMDERELDALIRSADAYASLHRSEGFGLTVAEAIMRQVPVVVTDWSGTTDFCPPDMAYAVAYELTRIDDPHPVYSELRHCRWAEPCVDSAAAHLRDIRANPSEARRRARKLRDHLRQHLSAHSYEAAVGSLVAAPSPTTTAQDAARSAR